MTRMFWIFYIWPISDVIIAVFEAVIQVKSTHLIKSRLKTRKKENMEIKDILYIYLHLRDRLDIEFTAC